MANDTLLTFFTHVSIHTNTLPIRITICNPICFNCTIRITATFWNFKNNDKYISIPKKSGNISKFMKTYPCILDGQNLGLYHSSLPCTSYISPQYIPHWINRYKYHFDYKLYLVLNPPGNSHILK